MEQKSLQPTVFNLQASDWVHCEEEIGAYYQLYRHTHKLLIYFFTNSYFAPQKYANLKKFPKIYYSFFFHKDIIGHTYTCNKCNDNFKFTLSLTLNGAKTFLAVPTNACLFSITPFLYGWQKILTNKNIFQKHDLHVLFIAFFCKMYNKENLFTTVRSLTLPS